MDPEFAIEVFVTAFARNRSLVYGCIPERHGGVWVMHDHPSRGADDRVAEVVGWEKGPDEYVNAGAALGGNRWAACVVGADLDGKKAPVAFREAGFRRAGKEPLFVRDLRVRAGYVGDGFEGVVKRVESEEEMENLRLAKGGRKAMRPEDLGVDDADFRVFYAVLDGVLAGRVTSCRVREASWVADLYVEPGFRRRGLGSALMGALAADDWRLGVRWSVLLASSTGALLYPRLGYEQTGLLHFMWPPGYNAGRGS